VGYSCWASDALCRVCFEELPRIGRPVCGRYGVSTAFKVYGCDECRDEDFEFGGARAPLRYEGVDKELVSGLKYKGYLPVMEKVIAPLMTGALGGVAGPTSWCRCRYTVPGSPREDSTKWS
jgi:predicted amidophosphoribosyltransferase